MTRALATPAKDKRTSEAVTKLVAAAALAAHGDMLLDDRFDEPIVVQVKQGFETACWVYERAVGHRVFIGDKVLDRARPGLSNDHQRQYIGKFLHHERAHAMLTERDREKIDKALADKKVPFGLFNLTEDGRIEHQYVESSEGTFSFEWEAYEAIEARCTANGATPKPSEALLCAYFNLIQTEGQAERVVAMYPECVGEATRDAVEFYEQTKACKDSFEAINVAARMLAKYPDMQPDSGRCGLSLGFSMQGPQGAQALAQFMQTALTPRGERPEAPEAEDKKAGGKGKSDGVGDKAFDGTMLLSNRRVRSLDTVRINRLADRLQRLSLKKSPVRETQASPGGRVSMRHALRGEARWQCAQVGQSPVKVRKLVLVVDVSGSMDGEPLEAAAYLIGALSEACRRGMLQGDVILSTTTPTGRDNLWQHKKLPWSLTEAERVISHSGEGLAATLDRHDKLLQLADLVLVTTDGDIGGAAIPHAAYKRRGLTVIGGYVNAEGLDQEAVIEQMQNHFTRLLLRNTVDGLVDALVLQPLSR